MREIKFRVWNDTKKSWCPDDIEENYPEDEVCFTIEPDRSNVYIMQFTGLKDKNGKEIYEGDIMSYKNSFPDDDNEKYYVVWDENGYWAIRYKSWDERITCRIDFFHRENGEVVGNIYENPELLEK